MKEVRAKKVIYRLPNTRLGLWSLRDIEFTVITDIEYFCLVANASAHADFFHSSFHYNYIITRIEIVILQQCIIKFHCKELNCGNLTSLFCMA